MELACKALGKLGAKYASAKPALTEALLLESSAVQFAARKALEKIEAMCDSNAAEGQDDGVKP